MRDTIRLDVELDKGANAILEAHAKKERRTKRKMAQFIIEEWSKSVIMPDIPKKK